MTNSKLTMWETAKATARNAERIADAAAALVARLDSMTTEEFAASGEKTEREALRAILSEFGYSHLDRD